MILENHWVGPTVFKWNVCSFANCQCQSLQATVENSILACKSACQEKESCNAIITQVTAGGFFCQLLKCRSPVPAPVVKDEPNSKQPIQGYFIPSGKNKR